MSSKKWWWLSMGLIFLSLVSFNLGSVLGSAPVLVFPDNTGLVLAMMLTMAALFCFGYHKGLAKKAVE